MHSPVLVNYDPTFESTDVWTDWDDYSDDFFDDESLRSKRRKKDKTGNGLEGAPATAKRKVPKSIRHLSKLSLGEPASSDEETHIRPCSTVVWKTKGDSPRLPVLRDGQEKKVSILRDWRERFKQSSKSPESNAISLDRPKLAFAVVIQSTPATDRMENGDAKASTSHFSSQQKRRCRSHDDLESDTSVSKRDTGKTTNGHARNQNKRAKGRSQESHEPVPANGATSTKRKRRPSAAQEPIPLKKLRAGSGPQEPSESDTPDQAVNGAAAHEPLEQPDEHKATGRLTRKRKLPDAEENVEPEPVPKKIRTKLSDKGLATGASRSKPTVAAGRRSTRQK